MTSFKTNHILGATRYNISRTMKSNINKESIFTDRDWGWTEIYLTKKPGDWIQLNLKGGVEEL